MEILVTIGYIAICVVMFSLAIAIHEFGHFIAALKLGLKVERFSIGFGPAIWKKTFRGVEFPLAVMFRFPTWITTASRRSNSLAGAVNPSASDQLRRGRSLSLLSPVRR